MKVYLILGLLVTATCAEKKINLEDIERDTLKAEGKTKAESIQTVETKYISKPNQPYQTPFNTMNHPSVYVAPLPPQQLQDIKYSSVPEEYQSNQYAVQEAQYKQQSQILPQQILPIESYDEYRRQMLEITKNINPIAFESLKLNYQPEIAVGNHVQSVQQKAVTEKYTKAINKDPAYIDVPVTQLLPYYPYLDANPLVNLKGAELAQPPLQFASHAAQQISIPVYAPVYNQKQLISSVKQPYSTVEPVTFTTKAPKESTYTNPSPQKKKINSAPLFTTPLYVQPQQPLAQEKPLLHTQAYITPSQPQYVHQLVYMQPGIIYSDHAAAYSDLYARLPAYIQDNYLRVNQQQLYIPSTIGQEVLQEQISQDLPQNFIKMPDEPKTHFVPPQFPPHDFKAGSTQLEPIRNSEDEQTLPAQDHSLPSEPRSLLDTYIPSKVIAAQDTARYKERPIKLEGGFLPSKVNFALKKRKSE